jgi:hypothetical protein
VLELDLSIFLRFMVFCEKSLPSLFRILLSLPHRMPSGLGLLSKLQAVAFVAMELFPLTVKFSTGFTFVLHNASIILILLGVVS